MPNSSAISERPAQTLWVSDVTKSYYQKDQQAKLQNLQAEVDCLLQQLQNIREQRLAQVHEGE